MTERDESGTPADPELETADAASRRRGRIRQQDENTTPREPTLAERRARERAERRRREEEEQRARRRGGRAQEAQAHPRRGRRHGRGRRPDRRRLRRGAAGRGDRGALRRRLRRRRRRQQLRRPRGEHHRLPAGGGFAFFPIFLGAGGRQYHYNYGGTGTIGQPVSGGTTTVPKDGTPVRTSSGSSTVTRGGLGVSKSSTGSSVGGSSSGGSKSGSAVELGRQQERRQLSGWSAGRAAPRAGWHKTVTEQGLVYDAPGRGQGGAERPYWDESVHYVVRDGRDPRPGGGRRAAALDVPGGRRPRRHRPSGSATSRCPSGAGRPSRRRGSATTRTSTAASTCATTAAGPCKLLEYNADTPTTLLEASILQWYWLKDVHPGDDQWNSLHEKLVERWATIADGLPSGEVHFTWSSGDATGEDHVTVGYLQETAAEAGVDTVGLAIEDIGWDAALDRFVDLEEAPMTGSSSSTPGSGCSATTSASTSSAACPRPCGSSRCGRRCCEQGAAGGAVGALPRPPEPAAGLPGPARPAHRVRPQAPPRPRGRQHLDRGAGHARSRPAASTARRATSTSSSTRCPSSTASAPRWGRGSSATRPPGWASARPSGW